MKRSRIADTMMRVVAAGALAALAAGCSTGGDRVVFATNTALAVDIDSAPPVLNIGYNRTEGVYGDVNDAGAAPPVVGSLRTNGSLFDVEVEQVYATGCASVLVQQPVDGAPPCRSENLLNTQNADRRMFFGTNTNFGLGLTFSATGPQGFHFGFKRKEVSALPRSESGAVNSIPSVIAALNIGSQGRQSDDGPEAEFGIVQFIGSGDAAVALAHNPQIRNTFSQRRDEALTGLERYDRNVATQYSQISLVLQCYLRLSDADKLRARSHAESLGLTSTTGDDRTYAMTVGVEDGSDADRTQLLAEHESFVCGLANT